MPVLHRFCMLACATRERLGFISEWDSHSRDQLLCGRYRSRNRQGREKFAPRAGVPWLTRVGIPIKLEESNRGCPDPREGAAVRFYSSPLGGRPIGRTPDSDSGYPGSSPGLPANRFGMLRKSMQKCAVLRTTGTNERKDVSSIESPTLNPANAHLTLNSYPSLNKS